MLGLRGVRLGIIKDGLYKMQVRALMEAARTRKDKGGNPIIEIMIPLVVTLCRARAGAAMDRRGDRRGASVIASMSSTSRSAR